MKNEGTQTKTELLDRCKTINGSQYLAYNDAERLLRIAYLEGRKDSMRSEIENFLLVSGGIQSLIDKLRNEG